MPALFFSVTSSAETILPAKEVQTLKSLCFGANIVVDLAHMLKKLVYSCAIALHVIGCSQVVNDTQENVRSKEKCDSCQEINLDCNAKSIPISPNIFGIAMNARMNYMDKDWVFELNPGSRRWGGNPTSRYNWRINSWNSAQDWYFKNTIPGKNFSFNGDFIDENNTRKISSYITLPLLGWVAKDSQSGSFSVSNFGVQDENDQSMRYGNGKKKNKNISTSPEYTSVKFSDENLNRWIQEIAIELHEPPIYALGNEPMLWNHTHRDVHPTPASYEEVFEKSLKYAKVVKQFPGALVAGPAAWGWTAYFYSALDMETGGHFGADQKKHKKPFLEWYLEKFREYEEATGTRLLDALDVHYYPQAKSVYHGGQENPDLRFRSTRSLWDNKYVDESWINEPIYLLPRMNELIEKSYPNTKLIIGEYSFGETSDVSGALSVAEALGSFAQYGVHAAYYWVYPKRYSGPYWGFRIFRNYDGKNSSFLGNLIGVSRTQSFSQYLSVDDKLEKSTIIIINSSKNDIDSIVTSDNCGDIDSLSYFEYDGEGGINRRSIGDNFSVKKMSLGLIEISFRAK